MGSKTKKVQVVLAAIDHTSQSFSFLLLLTNQKRGSFWQNITGSVEENETYEEGALRETIEETGLKVENIVDMLGLGLKYQFTDQWKRKVQEECYLIIVDTPFQVKIDAHEHQDFKWVSLLDIHPDIVKYPSNYEPLAKSQRILQHWGG